MRKIFDSSNCRKSIESKVPSVAMVGVVIENTLRATPSASETSKCDFLSFFFVIYNFYNHFNFIIMSIFYTLCHFDGKYDSSTNSEEISMHYEK